MVPVDLLMKEHKLIERIVPLLEKEAVRLSTGADVNSQFVIFIVDFIRMYGDRCHHGKEEDILFRALATKPLSDEHRGIMDQLTEEHVLARKLVGRLLLDEDRFVRGDKAGLNAIKADIRELAELYPRHMEKEDRHFFIPCLAYLSATEQVEMMRAFSEFDAKLIHEKYKLMIEDMEATQRGLHRHGLAL